MSDSKYLEDGVNVQLGDEFSSLCAKICKESYNNSPYVRVLDLAKGNFRGPRGFTLQNLPEGFVLTAVCDGVGTKVTPIVASGKIKNTPDDVIAMTAMDITRYGGLPLVFMNILDVHSLGETEKIMYAEIMNGLGEIAQRYSYVILGGETAELGACVGSEDPNAKLKFNLGGFMIGVYHPDRMIDGSDLYSDQIVIALREDGFRSNGLSSVRKAFRLKYGDDWFNNPEAKEDLLAATVPSVQYDRFLNYLNGWNEKNKRLVKLSLISHLTGGGFETKFGEVVSRAGFSADLDNLFYPPEIMVKCANWRGMSDKETYSTWNGGQGALVVLDKDEVDAFFKYAKQFDISARIAGRIIKKEDYSVRIKSRFSGSEILF